MTDTPQVTVILATYNGARFLRDQLLTLAAQTVLPLELIVADDRSEDETLFIVEEFARSAPFPVRIILNQKRLGYADNFLTASSMARTRLVAFCDQDDLWAENKLELGIVPFQRSEATLLSTHSVKIIDHKGDFRGRNAQQITRTAELGALSDNIWKTYLGFSLVFRRELLDVYDPLLRPWNPEKPNVRLPHDEWICFLARSLGRIHVIKMDLACHRQHGSNASAEHWRRGIRDDIVNAFARSNVGPQLRAEAARLRVDTLLSIAERHQSEYDLSAAIGAFQRVQRISESRVILRVNRNPRERIRIFLRLLFDNAYSGQGAGIANWRECIKDVSFGLFRLQGLAQTIVNVLKKQSAT